MIARLALLAVPLIIATGCGGGSDTTATTSAPEEKQWASAPEMKLKPDRQYTATVATDLGEFEIKLRPDKAPIAANNFVFLAREGFYEDVPIHRVLKDFVIQSGDPTGTGTGGPGYTISDEPITLPMTKGSVAMARTPAPDSAGSQFFVALADLRTRLPADYVVFGMVTKGMDVVTAIGDVAVQDSGSGEQSSPVEPIEVTDVEIHEAGDGK